MPPVRKLNNTSLFLFSLPALMQGFMHVPAGAILQGVYAKYTGLSLAAIGTAVLVSKIFDAVTDPLIGIFSDHRFRHSGTRKPFVVVGTLVTMLGLWFLYQPPQGVSVAYFLGWFMVAYLGWTITEIPFRAWSYELSSEYVWRTRIQVWLGIGGLTGAAAFYSIPYAAEALGLAQTTAIDLGTLRLAAIVTVGLMPIVNLIAIWWVPDGNRLVLEDKITFSRREAWAAVAQNKPLLFVLAGYFLAGLFGGLAANIAFLFYDGYLGIGDRFALLALVLMPVSLLSLPVWGMLCKRYDRKKVWALSFGAAGILYPLIALVPPGPQAFWPVLGLQIGVTFLISSSSVAGAALLGDVVDYGKWKLGRDYGGFYTAFQAFINKTVAAFSGSLGLIILAWFGFDATTTTQTASAVTGMQLVVGWVPGIGAISIGVIIWLIPITRASHEQILKEIEERKKKPTGAQTVDTASAASVETQ